MTQLAKRPTDAELRGLFQYYFETPTGLDIECWLEYELAEPQTHDHPGSPAAATLIFALVNDYDIADLLDEDVGRLIERLAQEYLEQAHESAKADATLFTPD